MNLLRISLTHRKLSAIDYSLSFSRRVQNGLQLYGILLDRILHALLGSPTLEFERIRTFKGE
jgi:hypothetical protein